MAFNKRAFWKYLYENDTGEYLPLNDILKKNSTVDDYKEIKAHFQHLGSFANHFVDLEPPTEMFDDPHHIDKLGLDGNTLDNFPIMGKITDSGRWYYVRAYSAQDFTDSQKKISASVITTNRVQWIAAGLTVLIIGYTAYIGRKNLNTSREALQLQHKEQQDKSTQKQLLEQVRVYQYKADSLSLILDRLRQQIPPPKMSDNPSKKGEQNVR